MRPTTFPVCVQLALQNGWHVRVYAWRSSCSGFYRELAEERTPRFTLVFLDEFAGVLGVTPYLATSPAAAANSAAAPSALSPPSASPPSVVSGAVTPGL